MAAAEMNVQRVGSEKTVIAKLSNDQLIIELLQTVNHLSRWLTPIHDQTALEYSPYRAQPSVKDELLGLRDTETSVYSFMYAISVRANPDLDQLTNGDSSQVQQEADREAAPLIVMCEFRRVRQSATSLLRALPDTAWGRTGYSRKARNWTIRQLAEYLAANDREALLTIDHILSQLPAREEIAEVSQVSYARLDEPFVSLATVGADRELSNP